jgi:hypothetical protein
MGFLRENWRKVAGMALAALLVTVHLAGQAGPGRGPANGTDTYTVFSSVEFTVPMAWKLVRKKADVQKALFVFEIPNAAAAGTSDATTFAVEAFDLKDADTKAAFEGKALPAGENVQSRKIVEGWDCSSYVTMHGMTTYDLWSCRRTVKDGGGVYITLAWPHLDGNPPDYGKQMRSALADVLTSIAPAPPHASLDDPLHDPKK